MTMICARSIAVCARTLSTLSHTYARWLWVGMMTETVTTILILLRLRPRPAITICLSHDWWISPREAHSLDITAPESLSLSGLLNRSAGTSGVPYRRLLRAAKKPPGESHGGKVVCPGLRASRGGVAARLSDYVTIRGLTHLGSSPLFPGKVPPPVARPRSPGFPSSTCRRRQQPLSTALAIGVEIAQQHRRHNLAAPSSGTACRLGNDSPKAVPGSGVAKPGLYQITLRRTPLPAGMNPQPGDQYPPG